MAGREDEPPSWNPTDGLLTAPVLREGPRATPVEAGAGAVVLFAEPKFKSPELAGACADG